MTLTPETHVPIFQNGRIWRIDAEAKTLKKPETLSGRA